MKNLLIFAALLPLLQNLLGMLQVLMVSIGKARLIAIRNLVVSLCRLGAVLVVILLVRNVAVMLMTTLVLDVLQILFFAETLRRNGCYVRIWHADFRLSRQILSYCIPMAIFIAINALNKDCDKYLIALLTDTQTLAMYSNASKPLPFDIIMASFCTVLLPEITRLVTQKEHKKAVALYRRFVEIAYIPTTIMCCAALTAAPQLMQLLYSEKYVNGLNIFCIYILVDMIRFTNITLILSAAGKTGKLMFLGIGALAGNMILNLIMFRWIGTIGPAVATLVTTAAVGIIMLRMNAKELEGHIQDFFDIRYLVTFLAENAAAVMILTAVRQRLEYHGAHYFVVLLVIGLLYAGLLLLLNGKRLMRNLQKVNSK